MLVLVIIFLATAILAIWLLINTPDHDRYLAYPDEPAAWGGIVPGGRVEPTTMLTSPLVWATAVCFAALVGLVLAALLRLPATMAFSLGLPVGVFIAARMATRRMILGGPAMNRRLPSQRRNVPKTKPRVLFICGSINQTTQMRQIAEALPEVEAYYTPYYSDDWFIRLGLKWFMQEYAICGYKRRDMCLEYLTKHKLPVDLGAERHDYDLVVLCSDQMVPPNVLKTPIVLAQEGITDPATWLSKLHRYIPIIPRYAAGTFTMGLSHQYEYFCVASEGYKEFFVNNGCDPNKLIVTGMPNFDNFERYYDNEFLYKDYVLVCTSDSRETFFKVDREATLAKTVEVAKGRQIIFKLHPNEKFDRAMEEIKRYIADPLVFVEGSAEEMIANCSVLITEYSSVTFVGIALGKEVYTCNDLDGLKKLSPLQNKCAAQNIANVCRDVMRDRGILRDQTAAA